MKGVFSGYIIGCGLVFFLVILVDCYDFLKCGFLFIGNFMVVFLIIGIVLIFVMWFGFDW